MAVYVEYMDVWKWINYDGTTYYLYGKMFDPNLNIPSTSWSSFNAVDTFSSINLLWFQPGLEVCVCCIRLENNWSSTESVNIRIWFEQDGVESIREYIYNDNIEAWYQYAYWTWVWIDPDEIRPWVWTYSFYIRLNWWSKTRKNFTVSNLSFDTTPHPAWYLWVEGDNLCYVPPSIYSGSKDTGYKHIISYDSWYSWAYAWTDKKWSIWIPSSSSDGHIYYVSQYGTVQRTMPAYEWSWWPSYVWSNKSWFIWMTPSTSSIPEQVWYNYLCYVDGWWYRRRMWVWEI